jgi:hypothetical protein
MILPDVTLTPGLAAMLARCADDGEQTLSIAVDYTTDPATIVEVHTDGGSELSASEQARVRGVLAAHAAEPM